MICVLIYSVLVLLYFDSIVIDYYYLYHIVIDYSFAQNCVKLTSYCYYYPTVMFFYSLHLQVKSTHYSF